MTDDEYNKFEDAILNGSDPKVASSRTVKEPPQGFKDYLAENSDRISGWKSTPYFIADNPQYVEGILK
jgi:hypothetical protein